jgi:hypothetical protein
MILYTRDNFTTLELKPQHPAANWKWDQGKQEFRYPNRTFNIIFIHNEWRVEEPTPGANFPYIDYGPFDSRETAELWLTYIMIELNS